MTTARRTTTHSPLRARLLEERRQALQAARRAQQLFDRAEAQAAQRRDERNAAVLDALAYGHSHAAVAEALGLSRGRIAQIAAARGDGG
jgi:DNA-binding NarL/FixJ family response regulator